MGGIGHNLILLPIWWYTTGFRHFREWYVRQFYYGLRKTAIILFARHFNEPFFGDYTRGGRILGYFLRTFMLILKLIFLSARILFISAMMILYLLILPAAIIMIVYQLIPI